MSAIDIRWHYLMQVKKFLAQQHIIQPSQADIVRLWETTLNQLEHSPGTFFDQLDWISKCHLIRQSKVALHSDAAKKIDLKYHELQTGYQEILEQQGKSPTLIAERVAEQAIHEPPDTRAALRSQYIKE